MRIFRLLPQFRQLQSTITLSLGSMHKQHPLGFKHICTIYTLIFFSSTWRIRYLPSFAASLQDTELLQQDARRSSVCCNASAGIYAGKSGKKLLGLAREAELAKDTKWLVGMVACPAIFHRLSTQVKSSHSAIHLSCLGNEPSSSRWLCVSYLFCGHFLATLYRKDKKTSIEIYRILLKRSEFFID
jgi:hypothetical protein